MTKIKDDNLPALVAAFVGLLFIGVSITLAMTVSVSTPQKVDAAQDQKTASSTEGFFDAFRYDVIENNQQATSSTTTDTSDKTTNESSRVKEGNDDTRQEQQTATAEKQTSSDSKANRQAVRANQLDDASETENRSFTDYRELENEIEEGDADFQSRLTNRDRLFGGEAVISDFTFAGWSNLREQETDDVGDISFRPENSDVLVSRADISFVHTGEHADGEPWDVFQRVSIKSDQETLASVSADNKSDWLDDGSDYDGSLDGDEVFAIRLNQLDTIIKRNDDADLSVHLTVKESIDDAGETSWGVFVDDAGVRAVDAIGVQHRFGSDTETVEFSIRERSDRQNDPEIAVDDSYHNPDESAIPVSATSSSGPFHIFAFDMNARDADAALEQIQLQMEIKGRSDSSERLSYNDIFAAAAIAIDEQVYTVDSISSMAARDDTAKFKLRFGLDDDVVVEEFGGETAKLLVRLRKAENNYQQGALIRASVPAGGLLSSQELTNQDGLAGSWHVLRSE